MKRFMVWLVLALAVLVFAVGALAQGNLDPAALPPTPVAPPDAAGDLGTSIADVLTDLIITKANVALMAATWALVQTARRLIPERAFTSQAWVRAEPMLAILLCSIGVWLPGLHTPGASLADTILLGIILGFVVGQSHKIGLQSVLGKDARLEEPTKPPADGGAP
jgi:hypothetical protein